MQLYTFIVGLSILWLVCGCSPDQQNTAENLPVDTLQEHIPDLSSLNPSDLVVYQCNDSLKFTAHITRDSTWLFLPDTTLKVMPVSSGSGYRYEGNAYLFWTKEQEAILQKPRGSFMTCGIIPNENTDSP